MQYFIDISKSSPLKVRSAVLFAVWNHFKDAGIGIPYPQQDLYIKEWPGGLALPQPEAAPPVTPSLGKVGG